VTGGMVQIVQRLSPGGIETLALGLAARLPGSNPVLSLDWSTRDIQDRWPALRQASVPIEGLEKPAGVQPAFVLRLARRLRALAPRAVVTHHIGPLLYGGLAARLAGVPVVAYVEHDVWHYAAARDRRMARGSLGSGAPQGGGGLPGRGGAGRRDHAGGRISASSAMLWIPTASCPATWHVPAPVSRFPPGVPRRSRRWSALPGGWSW